MSMSIPSMTDESADPKIALRSVFRIAGVACFLISIAWLVQMLGFTGDDVALARFEWAILSAFVAGIGLGFFLVGHYWVSRSAVVA